MKIHIESLIFKGINLELKEGDINALKTKDINQLLAFLIEYIDSNHKKEEEKKEDEKTIKKIGFGG